MKSGFKILVYGDVMVDRYVVGKHSRRSPEADIPILDFARSFEKLGGAANVASNLTAMGCTVSLCSVIGDDARGSRLQENCTYSGIESFFVKDSERPTTCKSRFIDETYRQYLRVDEESIEEINENYSQKIMAKISAIIARNRPDAIIIQDYNKGCVTESIILFLQKTAKELSIPLIADPKTKHFKLLSESSVFKPNINELSIAFGQQIKPEAAAIKSAIQKMDLGRNGHLFVTLAAKGIYYQNNAASGIVSGYNVENPDVSGAGDTVIAAITIAMLNGLKIAEMASFANKAGALACSKQGISLVSIEEIEKKSLKQAN